jgi:hypothetical protein
VCQIAARQYAAQFGMESAEFISFARRQVIDNQGCIDCLDTFQLFYAAYYAGK